MVHWGSGGGLGHSPHCHVTTGRNDCKATFHKVNFLKMKSSGKVLNGVQFGLEGRNQSVSQLFHGPAPRSPLHRLAVRLRHSRSNTSTEYSLLGEMPKVSLKLMAGPPVRREECRDSRAVVCKEGPGGGL